MSASHLIKQQVIEALVPDQDSARDIQEELSQVYKSHVMPVLKELFDEVDGHEEVITIDKLEVDIGHISSLHLKEEFPAKVKAALEEKIRSKVHASRFSSNASQVIGSSDLKRKQTAFLEAFIHYLRFGTLPWNHPKEVKSFRGLFQRLRETDPASLIAALKPELGSETTVQRIAFQLDDPLMVELLQLLIPDGSKKIMDLVKDLQALAEKTFIGSQVKTAKQQIWTVLLSKVGTKVFENNTPPEEPVDQTLSAVQDHWSRLPKHMRLSIPERRDVQVVDGSSFFEWMMKFANKKGFQIKSSLLRDWLKTHEVRKRNTDNFVGRGQEPQDATAALGQEKFQSDKKAELKESKMEEGPASDKTEQQKEGTETKADHTETLRKGEEAEVLETDHQQNANSSEESEILALEKILKEYHQKEAQLSEYVTRVVARVTNVQEILDRFQAIFTKEEVEIARLKNILTELKSGIGQTKMRIKPKGTSAKESREVWVYQRIASSGKRLKEGKASIVKIKDLITSTEQYLAEMDQNMVHLEGESSNIRGRMSNMSNQIFETHGLKPEAELVRGKDGLKELKAKVVSIKMTVDELTGGIVHISENWNGLIEEINRIAEREVGSSTEVPSDPTARKSEPDEPESGQSVQELGSDEPESGQSVQELGSDEPESGQSVQELGSDEPESGQSVQESGSDGPESGQSVQESGSDGLELGQSVQESRSDGPEPAQATQEPGSDESESGRSSVQEKKSLAEEKGGVEEEKYEGSEASPRSLTKEAKELEEDVQKLLDEEKLIIKKARNEGVSTEVAGQQKGREGTFLTKEKDASEETIDHPGEGSPSSFPTPGDQSIEGIKFGDKGEKKELQSDTTQENQGSVRGKESTRDKEDSERLRIPMSRPPKILEEAYIRNAGLVLIWPYLTTLFKGMGWVKEEEFISEEDRFRAIHFLQYLVVEEEPYEESDLVLNKLLCGLRAEDPVPAYVEFTAEEKEEATNLLEVVVQNWTVLKSTSAHGLRETFLKKEGLLKKDFNGWKLYVERSAIDILLERLPWGYSVIKLPWRDQMIYVEW